MKIIDKTPLLDENGNLGLMQRIQGMFEYGFSWPRELEAQKAIVSFFDRQLEKGYTLIRNITLGQSGIMIPIILIGPSGMYVIEVTHLRGRYEAVGEAWNVEAGDQYKPAPVNLIQRTKRMARALDAFIERQGVRVPLEIEPVIIAGDPGLHIDSNRPAIKVMMIDGIKAFVASVANGSPTLNGMQVNNLVEHIVNPRPRQDAPSSQPEPEPEVEPRAEWEVSYNWEDQQPQQPEPSRARAIFDVAREDHAFNPNDLSFAMGEDESFDIPPVPRRAEPARPARQTKPKQQASMGLTPMQIVVIAGLLLVLVLILATFVYMLL